MPTRADSPANPASPAPSVTSRVTTLLDLIGRRKEGIGPREAERATGIDRSAVSRMFRQLESLGWVEQIGDSGSYTVGPEMFALAAAVRQHDSLWKAAGPLLADLTGRLDETTYLAVRRQQRVVFRDKVDCAQRIRYIVELNEPFPLTSGAAGRAILSALPRDEVDAIVGEGLTAYTSSSITDPDRYRSQVGEDRSLGYSYSRSGWVAGGGGVASPFFNAAGECIGAITVSAPIDRLPPDRAAELGPTVRNVARALSRRLGYSGAPWGPSEDDLDSSI